MSEAESGLPLAERHHHGGEERRETEKVQSELIGAANTQHHIAVLFLTRVHCEPEVLPAFFLTHKYFFYESHTSSRPEQHKVTHNIKLAPHIFKFPMNWNEHKEAERGGNNSRSSKTLTTELRPVHLDFSQPEDKLQVRVKVHIRAPVNVFYSVEQHGASLHHMNADSTETFCDFA